MRQWKKSRSLAAVFFLLALGLWLYAWQLAKAGEADGAYVNGYYETSHITAGQLERLLEEREESDSGETPEAAGWLRQEQVPLQRTDGQKKEGTVFKVEGAMGVLFSSDLCGGNLPWSQDEKGCLMSTALAQELYGTDQAQGNRVYAEGREYFVRGVVEEREKFLAVPAQENDELTGIRLRYKEPDPPLSLAQSDLYQLTGAYPEAVFEGVFYRGTGSIFLFLPVWTLELACMGIFLGRCRAVRNGNLRILVRVGIVFLTFAVIAAELPAAFRFSEDYLPTMWSELSFFPELLEKKREMAEALSRYRICSSDQQVLERTWKLGIFAGASILSGLFGSMWLKLGKKKKERG